MASFRVRFIRRLLAVDSGLIDLREPVLDAVSGADTPEHVGRGPSLMVHVGELDAVIGKHGVQL